MTDQAASFASWRLVHLVDRRVDGPLVLACLLDTADSAVLGAQYARLGKFFVGRRHHDQN